MSTKWSAAGFVQQATVALTDNVMGLVGGVNSKFTLTVLQAALTKVGAVTVTQPASAATLTLAQGSTLATSGAFSITLTSTATTNVTLPTSGTLMTNPMTTGGDVIYGGASGVPTRLANGTAGQFLQSNGTTLAPSWATAAGSGNVTAGGTLTASQLVIGAGTTAVAALGSLGTATTVLHGNAGGAPTFGAVDLAADVTGALNLNAITDTTTARTFLSTDKGLEILRSNVSAMGDTLPQATGAFGAGWSVMVRNRGTAALTITPTTSTINGASTLVLVAQQGGLLVSDGTNYDYYLMGQVAPNTVIVTPTLTLKQSSAPTPTAEGDIQWDTDDNKLLIGDGAAAQTFVSTAAVSGAATMSTAGALTLSTNLRLGQLTLTVGNGTDNIAANDVSFCIPCVFAGTLSAYTIQADAGTCTVKIWKKATGTARPTISDVINTSGVSLSSGTVIRSTTLSDFTTTTFTANDLLICQATAVASSPKQITMTLEITKSN